MNFEVIGRVHQYESEALSELAKIISTMSRDYQEIAKFYKGREIKLTRNQHKVLSFLYSIYYLDNQNESSRTRSTTREISEAVSVDIEGNWARKNCRKLLKLNFITINSDNKWYITKYGVFYMHCETRDQDWSEALIHNASIGALEKDLSGIITRFIKNKIGDINEKFKEKEKKE